MADQARLAFAGEDVRIAFVNAGSLRLNQDIPPGAVTLEHVEELPWSKVGSATPSGPDPASP